MFILRLRGRTRRMRVEQFIDSKEDNRRVHPCSDCYIVDLNLFHLNNLKPSSKFFTWFEVDSWNPSVFFSTCRLPPWAKPRPNARITAWFCSVTRCWFSVASMVTTGWAWGRFGCGRVCEISRRDLRFAYYFTYRTYSILEDLKWEIFIWDVFWCFEVNLLWVSGWNLKPVRPVLRKKSRRLGTSSAEFNGPFQSPGSTTFVSCTWRTSAGVR